MLVGVAAHQADPISAGGITNAMLAGKLAAEVAAEAIAAGDVAAARLAEYPRRWDEALSQKMARNCCERWWHRALTLRSGCTPSCHRHWACIPDRVWLGSASSRCSLPGSSPGVVRSRSIDYCSIVIPMVYLGRGRARRVVATMP
jgi:hypothetical protein